MQKFRHFFLVNAEIELLWQFYTDIKHLEIISPPSLDLVVIRTTHQRLEMGSEVWLAGKLVTRSKWHSRITSLSPYEYVDEMISGRFKVWKHVHRFLKKGDEMTEVIDEIEFELGYGILGRLFEGYVKRRLREVFAHREVATISEFSKAI
jgi:ligand-binding SRPBCC domain-containing protein